MSNPSGGGADEHSRLRELHEEEERMKLKMLQADAGLIGGRDLIVAAERMDWMYYNPAQAKKDQEDEDFLLGKAVTTTDEREEMRKRLGVGTTAVGSLFLPSVTNQNDDTLRRIREDPLFMIRQAEHQQKRLEEARQRIIKSAKHMRKNAEEEKHKGRHSRDDDSTSAQEEASKRRGRGESDDDRDRRHHRSRSPQYERHRRKLGPQLPLRGRDHADTKHQDQSDNDSSRDGSEEVIGPPRSMGDTLDGRRKRQNECPSVWRSTLKRTPAELTQLDRKLAVERAEASLRYEEDRETELKKMLEEGKRHEAQKFNEHARLDRLEGLVRKQEEQKRRSTAKGGGKTSFVRKFERSAYLDTEKRRDYRNNKRKSVRDNDYD